MDPVTLKPSKKKWLAVSAIGLLFTIGGVFMILEGKVATGWFATLFFALVGGVGIYMIFSSTNYLRLDGNGFEQKMMGRTTRVAWSDVTGFGSVTISGNTFVTYSQASQLTKTSGKINQQLVGATGQLADSFGMKAEELIALMHQYRQHAMQSGQSPS